MTTSHPTGPPPDDELLSRALDGDLGAAEAAALEERLAGDEALRAELAALRRVRDVLGEVAPAPAGTGSTPDLTALRARALEAFDEERATATAPANEGHLGAVTALAGRRRWWARPQLLGASAAAALVLVAFISLLADRGDGDDSGGASQLEVAAEAPTSGDAEQRAAAPAVAADRAGDATTNAIEAQAAPAPTTTSRVEAAGSVLATPIDLGSFDDPSELVAAIRNVAPPAPAAGASPTFDTPTTAAGGQGSGASTAPASPATSTTAPAGTTGTGFDEDACAETHTGTATLAGRAVRWSVAGGDGAAAGTIVVVDATTCDVITEQAR